MADCVDDLLFVRNKVSFGGLCEFEPPTSSEILKEPAVGCGAHHDRDGQCLTPLQHLNSRERFGCSV